MITTEYKIYEVDTDHLKERDSFTNGKEDRVCFIQCMMKGLQANSFESYELAVKYLIDNNMEYRDYVILPILRVDSSLS